jgi:glyoxylase-like metal-dependent hydrolase (beta-lactamase superfamily II)
VYVKSLRLGPLETNCWIVADCADAPMLVIDPGGDVERLLRELSGRVVSGVVLTHAHFDHLGAATALIKATGAPLMVHEADAERVLTDAPEGTGGATFGFLGMTAPTPDRLLHDGDEIAVRRLKLKVLHTPGHTQGGISLLAADPDGGPAHLFSGDTLFAGSVGRTDFPGGDARALSRSIATQFVALAPDTVVHPGHGPDTTIGREARLNPFWPRA